jgi:hypothetical protein
MGQHQRPDLCLQLTTAAMKLLQQHTPPPAAAAAEAEAVVMPAGGMWKEMLAVLLLQGCFGDCVPAGRSRQSIPAASCCWHMTHMQQPCCSCPAPPAQPYAPQMRPTFADHTAPPSYIHNNAPHPQTGWMRRAAAPHLQQLHRPAGVSRHCRLQCRQLTTGVIKHTRGRHKQHAAVQVGHHHTARLPGGSGPAAAWALAGGAAAAAAAAGHLAKQVQRVCRWQEEGCSGKSMSGCCNSFASRCQQRVCSAVTA